MSLAEKGRVGVGGDINQTPVGVTVTGGSCSASSSGSTTSGDDDLLTHRSLRHRDPRGYTKLSPSGSPYQRTYEVRIYISK